MAETLSGLKLGQSTVDDIQSRLGPTLMFRDQAAVTTRRMCYVSDKDYTLIAFTTERNIIKRLQVLSDKHRYNRWDWCTATPMSAADLTLANQITLGTRPEKIVSLLGKAHKKGRDNWRYTYALDLPQSQPKSNPPEKIAHLRAHLKLVFTNSRLTHFDIKTSDCDDPHQTIRPYLAPLL